MPTRRWLSAIIGPETLQDSDGAEITPTKIWKFGDGLTVSFVDDTLELSADGAEPGGTASGDLSGTYPAPTVAKIQGRAVASTAPSSGYVLTWNAGLSQWEPTAPSAGAPGGSDKQVQYRVDSTTFGGVSGFTRETSTLRIDPATRPLEVGASNFPASGSLRWSHGITIYGKNQGASADAGLFRWGSVSNNQLEIGDATASTVAAINFKCVDSTGGHSFFVGPDSFFDVYDSYVQLGGGTVAGTGTMRVKNAFTLYSKTSGGTNTKLLDFNSSNNLEVGESTSVGQLQLKAASYITAAIGGSGLLEIGSTYLSVGPGAGTTTATAGAIRLSNNTSIQFRDSAATGNMIAVIVDASSNCTFGHSGANAGQSVLQSNSSQEVHIWDNVNYRLATTAATIGAAQPIIGYSAANSPYAVHGSVTSGLTDVTTYTVPVGEYKYGRINATTALSADCDFVWPNPSSLARSYGKTFKNATTKNIVHKTGAATTTITQATGTTWKIWIEPDVVTQAQV